MRNILLAAVGVLAGCGPVRSTSALIDASAAVSAVQIACAAQSAPYELAAAEAYLEKAREEQGYADFEVSIALAGRATACARAALIRIEGTPPPEPEVEPLPPPACRPARVGTATAAVQRDRPPGERFRPVPQKRRAPATETPPVPRSGPESSP